MRAITTFPLREMDRYGSTFLRTYAAHWKIPLTMYHEGEAPRFRHPLITYKSLTAIEGYEEFLQFCHTDRRVRGIQQAALQPGRINPWLYDAARFCHKVFAQFDAVEQHYQRPYNGVSECVIWLDGDIVTLKDVPVEWLSGLVIGHPFTFCGRDSFSELGFLGLDPNAKGFEEFWRRYNWLYRDRALFDLSAWTDCHAFDHARKGIEGQNLTPHGHGVDHVWMDSPLAEYMDHLKGPARKNEGRSPEYGEDKDS